MKAPENWTVPAEEIRHLFHRGKTCTMDVARAVSSANQSFAALDSRNCNLSDGRFGAPTVLEQGVAVRVELDDACTGSKVACEVARKTSGDAGDGTAAATVFVEALYLEGLESVTGLESILAQCFRRICTWRTPCNWSPCDWLQELKAHAVAAAYEAQTVYARSRGVPFAGFVYLRVVARVLTHCRREWAYAHQCIPDSNGNEESGDPATCLSSGLTHEDLRTALEALPEGRRWVLKQLFWHGRTQANLALELGVTQQAVDKRKQQAMQLLRAALR